MLKKIGVKIIIILVRIIKLQRRKIMDNNEKFGSIIVEGKVINLDNTKIEDLKKIEEDLKVKIQQKKKKIKNYLEDNEL